MKLAKVFYELFGGESEGVLQNPLEHEIDREVHLLFSDLPDIYITWQSKPVQYCLGISETTSFSPPIHEILDMSDGPLWKGLIGREVLVEFQSGNRRHILVSAEGAEQVHLLSYDEDIVRIRRTPPLPGEPQWEYTEQET